MKAYGFQVDPKLIKYNSSIRSKSDIIKLIIGIVRFFNFASPIELENLTLQENTKDIVLTLYIDKMSRVIITENGKIHTFHFPFNLIILDGNMKTYYNGIELDNGILSIMTTAFRDLEDWQSIEQIVESYWEAIDDFNISTAEAQNYNSLITFFLSFEPGYLRFDYDEKNVKDGLHPLNHLDVNYTNRTTFKVGLQNKINHVQLIDILNISTPCMILK